MAYKISPSSPDIIIRLSDGANIPKDPRNMDYQEYLATSKIDKINDESLGEKT